MRIGPSHRDVSILLVGALSRWVNHLEDEEMEKPKTKQLLKALRKLGHICGMDLCLIILVKARI